MAAQPGVHGPHVLPRLAVDPVTEPSAFDRLTRASGPTPTDRDDELEQLRRENAALRRLAAEIEEERIQLIRLAEARDRGPIRTDT